MPAAVTLWAASLVPVNQDTLEMDLPAQLNKNILYCCATISNTSQMTNIDDLYMYFNKNLAIGNRARVSCAH